MHSDAARTHVALLTKAAEARQVRREAHEAHRMTGRQRMADAADTAARMARWYVLAAREWRELTT